MAWPFRSRGAEHQLKAEVARLAKELEVLRTQNNALQQSLAAAGTVAGEYLYRWRSVALPLLGTEWELRYFVLQGTTIRYYKTSKDVAFSPREEFSLTGCSVEWQGLQGTRFWVWALLDDSGSVLLRVGSPSEQTALKWLYALEDAGCMLKVAPPSLSRQQSTPMPTRRGVSSSGVVTGQHQGSETRQHHNNWSPTTTPPPRPFTPQPPVPVTTAPQSPEGLPVHSSTGTPAGPLSPTGRSPAHGRCAPPPSARLTHSSCTQSCSGHTQSIEDRILTPSKGVPPQGSGVGPPPRKSLETPAAQGRGAMLPSHPVNTATRSSYLSSERMWHEKHTGILNLMAVILVATNFRLALENAMKYGWRYNPVKALRDLTIGNPNIPVALCYPVLVVLAALSLASEGLGAVLLRSEQQYEESLSKKEVSDPKVVARLVRARRSRNEWLLFLINTAVTCASIAVPWVAISLTTAEPLPASVLICLAVVLWMKLVSFHHCCFDLRNARRLGELRPGERGSPSSGDWALLAYPENLTASHLAYFLAAPTLCYQVNYPRSGPIRWKWLARRVGELVVMLTVLSIIVKQYMEPAIANSMAPLRQMDFLHLCERLLKLALPNTYCWLVMFYCLFHLWLNILAELLRFGDREFYKDWWNAPTLGEYWKLWNMPVHKWLLRHVYFPSLQTGMSRTAAMVLVFFVSAIFHELVCGVPLHCVRLWAFTGIMLQVPMILVTEFVRKKLNRDEAGNYVFWLTFCVVGQPLSILLYAHDYYYMTATATAAF